MEYMRSIPLTVIETILGMIPGRVRSVLELAPGDYQLVSAMRNEGLDIIAPKNCNTFIDSIRMAKLEGRSDYVCWDMAIITSYARLRLGRNILYEMMGYCNEIIAILPWSDIVDGDNKMEAMKQYGMIRLVYIPGHILIPYSPCKYCVVHLRAGYIHSAELRIL